MLNVCIILHFGSLVNCFVCLSKDKHLFANLQAVSSWPEAVLLVEESFPNPRRTEAYGSGCASVKQTLMYCCQKEKCPMQQERFAAVFLHRVFYSLMWFFLILLPALFLFLAGFLPQDSSNKTLGDLPFLVFFSNIWVALVTLFLAGQNLNIPCIQLLHMGKWLLIRMRRDVFIESLFAARRSVSISRCSSKNFLLLPLTL